MAQRRMLTLHDEGRRFTCRVAGVALDAGFVLLHSDVIDDFWTLPGGRAEMGEDSQATLAREMSEELAVDAKIGRLLFLVENFFDYAGFACHELLFIYEMHLPDHFPRNRGEVVHRLNEGAGMLDFRWVATDPDSLAKVRLLPSFLRRQLGSLPNDVEHLIWSDRS
ncbi:MAG: NUDIX hydrolase [Rhizobiaceae bacterium]